MHLIAIDPGLYSTGIAYQDTTNHVLPTVYTVKPSTGDIPYKVRYIVREIPDLCWDVLWIEKPQVYRGTRMIGDPNDLISLAILVGGLASLVSAYHKRFPKPCEWKRQVPKKIHHTRILAKVPELKNKKFSLDAMDALGLLLWGREQLEALAVARKRGANL